jgi:hypothetical protein
MARVEPDVLTELSIAELFARLADIRSGFAMNNARWYQAGGNRLATRKVLGERRALQRRRHMVEQEIVRRGAWEDEA